MIDILPTFTLGRGALPAIKIDGRIMAVLAGLADAPLLTLPLLPRPELAVRRGHWKLHLARTELPTSAMTLENAERRRRNGCRCAARSLPARWRPIWPRRTAPPARWARSYGFIDEDRIQHGRTRCGTPKAAHPGTGLGLMAAGAPLAHLDFDEAASPFFPAVCRSSRSRVSLAGGYPMFRYGRRAETGDAQRSGR